MLAHLLDGRLYWRGPFIYMLKNEDPSVRYTLQNQTSEYENTVQTADCTQARIKNVPACWSQLELDRSMIRETKMITLIRSIGAGKDAMHQLHIYMLGQVIFLGKSSPWSWYIFLSFLFLGQVIAVLPIRSLNNKIGNFAATFNLIPS